MGKTFLDTTDKLKPNNPHLVAAQNAFTALKAQVKAIPEYTDLATLMIDPTRGLATLTMTDGKQVILTTGELKAKMATISSPDEAENEVAAAFDKFRLAFMRMGTRVLSHYSARGPDTLASQLGGKPLNIDRHSPYAIQSQQSLNLVDGSENKHGLLSLIKTNNGTEADKKELVNKALRAEAFYLHFRESIETKIADLKDAKAKEPDPKKKQPILEAIETYTKLHDDLLDAKRHALWASAMYSNPEECFERILYDYYEQSYGDAKPMEKPSFAKFRSTEESVSYREHAAETASLLITDPKDYRLFCAKHGIEPKGHHINRLLNHVINAQGQLPAIPFGTFGYTVSKPVQDEIDLLATASMAAANNLESQVDPLDAPDKTAEERLKVALKAKQLFPLLKDARTTFTLSQRAFKRLSNFWNS
jgi:hypothetical protein